MLRAGLFLALGRNLGVFLPGIEFVDMTLQAFISCLVERLSAHYPVQEAKAIAVRLLKESLAGYKGYEHLVEPERDLTSFALEARLPRDGQSVCNYERLAQVEKLGSAVGDGGVVAVGGGVGAGAGAAEAGDGGAEHFLVRCAERLAAGEPLQYVLGYEWFCGHRFNVAPGVLIPRPETEELVQQVIGEVQGRSGHECRVLDICTGSGCIALSVAAGAAVVRGGQSVVESGAGNGFGQGVEVFGCDISPVALEVSRGQRVFSDVDSVDPVRVKFFECDILSSTAQERILSECGGGDFDIIVSNPPYVCECEKAFMHRNVLEHEPHLALFVPDSDPLRFYRRIGELSGRLLKRGGVLFFEINERFGKETVQMLEGMGFEDCRVLQDLFGKERMVLAKKMTTFTES